MAGIAGPYSAAQPAISAGGAGRNCPLADRSAEHVAFGQSGTASIVSSITSTFRLCLN
jgi:hypothetical protein